MITAPTKDTAPLFEFVEKEKNGGWNVTRTADLAAFLISRPGVTICGTMTSRKVRAELQGHPYLSAYCGPMWGGTCKDTGRPIVRYENQEANDRLSA